MRTQKITPREKFIKGWAGALIATGMAASAHSFAGHSVPLNAWVLISLVASGLICVSLAGKELSLWRLCAAVCVSQGAFHTIFSLTGGGNPVAQGGSGFVAPGGATASMGHAGHDAGPPPTPISDALPVIAPSPGMFLSHVCAALLTVFMLRRGEIALLTLLSWLAQPLASVLKPNRCEPLQVNVWVPAQSDTFLSDLLIPLAKLRYRGPPVI